MPAASPAASTASWTSAPCSDGGGDGDGRPPAADLSASQPPWPPPAVARILVQLAARLVLASHPEQPDAVAEVKRYVSYGSSPRGPP